MYRRIGCVGFAVPFSFTPLAMASIMGFSGGGAGADQWSLNLPKCCGSIAPTISSDTLHLSKSGWGGGSAFYNTPQDLGVGGSGFTVSFDMQLKVGTNLRDRNGMTFTMHNDPLAAKAIGSTNNAYGYGTNGYPNNGTAIKSSVAFYIDFATTRFGFIENPAPDTTSFTNIPSGSTTAGGFFPDVHLDLTNTKAADPVRVTLNYDGAKTLTATLTNSVHPNSATFSYTLNSADLAAATGSTGGTAYVGFTEGGHGAAVHNDISSLSFSSGHTAPPDIAPAPVTPPGHKLTPYSGPAKTWRIMPVGDSITNGSTGGSYPFTGGYRTVLNSMLTAENVPHLFVGNRQTGPQSLIDAGQARHCGWDGKGTQYVLDNIYKGDGTGWLETQNPDIVLLQIGINDDLVGGLAATESRLDQAVQKMFDWADTNNPDFHLLIAAISGYSSYDAKVINYNNYIRDTLVPKYLALGKSIVLVDQYSQFERLDREGNPKDPQWIDPYLWSLSPHPNEPGYDRMAQPWNDGIISVVPEPTSSMVVVGLCALAMGRAHIRLRPKM